MRISDWSSDVCSSDLEMKTWIHQTVRVAGVTTDTHISQKSLPWTVAQRENSLFESTIPEDVMYALQTYIDDMTKDLLVVRGYRFLLSECDDHHHLMIVRNYLSLASREHLIDRHKID